MTRARLPRTPDFARVRALIEGAQSTIASAMVTGTLGGDPTVRSIQAAAALRSAADELDPRPAWPTGADCPVQERGPVLSGLLGYARRDAERTISADKPKDGGAEHTPGPWSLSVHPAGTIHIGSPRVEHTVIDTSYPGPHSVSAEDARLIAAAPDLLEACEAIVKWGRSMSTNAPVTPAEGPMHAITGDPSHRDNVMRAKLNRLGLRAVTVYPANGRMKTHFIRADVPLTLCNAPKPKRAEYSFDSMPAADFACPKCLAALKKQSANKRSIEGAGLATEPKS